MERAAELPAQDKQEDRCHFKRLLEAVTRSLLQARGKVWEAAPSRCWSVNSRGSGASLSSKVGALLGGRGWGGG